MNRTTATTVGASGGQALVLLLFYLIIAITITTMAVAVVSSNSMMTTQTEASVHALEVAEAGAEIALISLLRSPSYTGETLTVGGGSATVTVGGAQVKTIDSRGTVGNFQRSIRVTVRFENGIMSIQSWEEL